MKAMHLPVLILALLSVILSACVASPVLLQAPESLDQVSERARPTPSNWDFPRGRFRSLSAPSMVILAIENDGSFRIYRDNTLLDAGRFEISGAEVTVDSQACSARGFKPAVYGWSYDYEQLFRFVPTDTDPCTERRQYLADEYEPRYAFV